MAALEGGGEFFRIANQIGNRYERLALSVRLLQQGIDPNIVEPEQALMLKEILSVKREQSPDDLIAHEASEPGASYSIRLKYLRSLRVSGQAAKADKVGQIIASLFPDAKDEPYSPECAAQHEEVLRWQKT